MEEDKAPKVWRVMLGGLFLLGPFAYLIYLLGKIFIESIDQLAFLLDPTFWNLMFLISGGFAFMLFFTWCIMGFIEWAYEEFTKGKQRKQ